VKARPGQAGLVCPRCHIRMATAKAVEVVLSRAAEVLLSLTLLPFFSPSRPCSGDHNEMARMASRPWWRVLVGGKLGGARRIIRVVGLVGG
jgi:hypothetical protein